jgi:regulatory LacI family protein
MNSLRKPNSTAFKQFNSASVESAGNVDRRHFCRVPEAGSDSGQKLSSEVNSRDSKSGPFPSKSDGMEISEQTELHARPCTVKDVARLAGVSVATVSRVVNGTANVSGLTQARVLTAISTLQYCPNTSAAALGRAGGGISKKRGIPSARLGAALRQS